MEIADVIRDLTGVDGGFSLDGDGNIGTWPDGRGEKPSKEAIAAHIPVYQRKYEAALARADTQQSIAALEATITNRRIREAALSDAGKAWLAGVDAQIAALRVQL